MENPTENTPPTDQTENDSIGEVMHGSSYKRRILTEKSG